MEADLVAQQRREIETLRERIRQLEEALTPPSVYVPLEWCLTLSEARVFAHLTSRSVGTKQSIYAALYGAGSDDVDLKVVDVFVCKLRKKLRRFGVQIETVWGQGYALRDAGRYRSAAA